MKKTTVSLHASSNEAAIVDPSRSKSPTALKRKTSRAINRNSPVGASVPRNGARHMSENDNQLHIEHVLAALEALKKGNFSTRLPVAWTGIAGKVADSFNGVAELMSNSTEELSRISRVVGKEGRIQERLSVGHVTGDWSERVNSVNTLLDCLAHPIRETARVIGAVAKGDLSQSMAMEIEGRKLEGDFLRTAKTVNTMVNQLGAFASEVNRVAREVGTEGKLGGQAKVKGVAGTWKDLTDNVNLMASNLTSQVRNIATMTTAVANGDLTKKNHRRRPRRISRTQRYDQHDGRSASLVCIGSDPRRARSRHRRQTRRSGQSRRCVRYLERSH